MIVRDALLIPTASAMRKDNHGRFSATEIRSFDFVLVAKGSLLLSDSLPLNVSDLSGWQADLASGLAEQVIAAWPGMKRV